MQKNIRNSCVIWLMVILAFAGCRKDPSVRSASIRPASPTPSDTISQSKADSSVPNGNDVWEMPARRSCQGIIDYSSKNVDTSAVLYRTIHPIDLFQDSVSDQRYVCTLDTGLQLTQVQELEPIGINLSGGDILVSAYEWLDTRLEPESFSVCGGGMIYRCPIEGNSEGPFGYGTSRKFEMSVVFRKSSNGWGHWQSATLGEQNVNFFSAGLVPVNTPITGWESFGKIPSYGILVAKPQAPSLKISEQGIDDYYLWWTGRKLLLSFPRECVSIHSIQDMGKSTFLLKGATDSLSVCNLESIVGNVSGNGPIDSLEFRWQLKPRVMEVKQRRKVSGGQWSDDKTLYILRPEAFAKTKITYSPFYVDEPNPGGDIEWNDGKGTNTTIYR